MSVRGRRPTPTVTKEVGGNPGKRALNSHEPKPGKIGAAPSGLSPAALLKWAEMTAPEVWGPVATAADRDQLAEYCRLSARKAEAEDKILEHGALVASPNGFPVQSPWLQIVNKCRADMYKIAQDFGGTPASRTRVKVVSDGDDDPADAFFGRPN